MRGSAASLFEPATACRVAAGMGVSPDAAVYDLSNACLGVLNGMLDVANRIELGQGGRGDGRLVETAREINDIDHRAGWLQAKSMDVFKNSLATLSGELGGGRGGF